MIAMNVGHKMSKTTITDPQGGKTTIQSSGCGGNGCMWVFAIALVIGSCMSAPVLIIPTVAIAGLFVYLKGKQQ